MNWDKIEVIAIAIVMLTAFMFFVKSCNEYNANEDYYDLQKIKAMPDTVFVKDTLFIEKQNNLQK